MKKHPVAMKNWKIVATPSLAVKIEMKLMEIAMMMTMIPLDHKATQEVLKSKVASLFFYPVHLILTIETFFSYSTKQEG